MAAQNSFEEHLYSATAGAAGDLQTGVREIDQFLPLRNAISEIFRLRRAFSGAFGASASGADLVASPPILALEVQKRKRWY